MTYARRVHRSSHSPLARALVSGALLVATLLAAGCGPSIPPRYVLEADLDDYRYRRYQEVLDVEFPVEGNPATGHTATYVNRSDEALLIATAFVSVYERPDSLSAEVRDYLATLSTYDVEVTRLHRHYIWRLRGDDDRWLLWVSGRYVVKLGALGEEIPSEVTERYLRLFDSDLDGEGNARSGAESAGPSRREEAEREADALSMPSGLR